MKKQKWLFHIFASMVLLTSTNASAQLTTSELINRYSQSYVKDNYYKTSIAYPTGKQSTSAVLLEKHFPMKATVGQPYLYIIKAVNLTDLTLENIEVSEFFTNDYQIVSTEPRMKNKIGSRGIWEFEKLAPNETIVIKIVGQVEKKENFPCCTKIDYDLPSLCHNPVFVKPEVSLEINVPKEVLICNKIPLEFTIKNSGDVPLQDVLVTADLPRGIISSTGLKRINLEVGQLKVGESRNLVTSLEARKTGDYRMRGFVTSSDASSDSEIDTLKVVQPRLALEVKANHETQYIGRDIEYVFKVKNPSSVKAEGTVVEAMIPENTKLESASHDGQVAGRKVKWKLGTLLPYKIETMSMRVKTVSAGTARMTVEAKAECCENVLESASVRLVGIPALKLEVVDVVDPIEIGGEQIYIIEVTNQGTDYAKNIVIRAQIEGMEYVSDTGATSGVIQGDTISFRPVLRLAPKESATWRIKTRGKEKGDQRFKVSLTSDELTRPVEEAESTFVY